MPTYNWEVYFGTDVGWTDIDVNTLVFSGDPANINIAINVDEFNSGTHLGNDDPGVDQCGGATHIYNIKYADAGYFYGGSSTTSEAISNTNLTTTEATIRLKFTNTTGLAISAGHFFCFDGVTETAEAVGILAYAVEAGVGSNTWTKINDDAANIGGNNNGEVLELAAHTQAQTEHFWYIAISVSPQTFGRKTQFDFGVALTYS